MKRTLVTLSVPAHGMRKEFTLTHAERLLRMPNNGGWQLPANSEYEYDARTGLRLKRDTSEATVIR